VTVSDYYIGLLTFVLRETALAVLVKLMVIIGAEAVVQNLALAVSAALGVYSQHFIFFA
jgi:hypothetical protein